MEIDLSQADPRPQRTPRRREPRAARRGRRLRARPDGIAGRRQDLDDPGHHRRPARPLPHRRHRGRHREQGRRREGQGARHPGGPDQHRRRLPPRERHDQARGRCAAARRTRPDHHRERGQSGVPDRLLPRREREGHDPLGARGPRQAVQVPGHLPDLRGRHPQQGRHDARTSTSTKRSSRGVVQLAQPHGADLPHRRDQGRGRRGVGRVARCSYRRRSRPRPGAAA